MRCRGFCSLVSCLALLLLVVGMLPRGAAATIVDLNFDTLPNGSMPTNLQPVGSTYAAMGVVFGSLDGPGAPPPVFYPDDGFETEFSVAGYAHAGPGSHGFHIRASFTDPVTTVSAETTMAAGFAVMTAYDALGTQLGTIAAPLSGIHILSLSGIGEIASIVWTGTDPFYARIKIDDLSYTIVPEPGTAALLGLGLLGLAARVRRREARRQGPRL
jgi:hypothetical protein